MDWKASISDIDFSSNNSQSSDDPDADDEQSDWPESLDLKRSGVVYHQTSQTHFTKIPQRSVENPGLDTNVLRRIERFVTDSRQQELIISQVYRTSVVSLFYVISSDLHQCIL